MTKIIYKIKNTSLYKTLSVLKMSIKDLHLMLAVDILKINPIRKNKIVFSSFHGMQFNAQPRQIYEELIKYEIDEVDIVWILPKSVECPGRIRVVRPHSVRALYELMTAKIWIDNCRKDYWIRRRKEQYYIQTWHGPVCIKAVEKDAEDTLPLYYILSAKQDSKNASLIVSESDWRTKNIEEAFWYSGEILRAEFKNNRMTNSDSIEQNVRKHYNIGNGEKLVLYAPTFRKNGGLNCYKFDYMKFLNTLKQKSGAIYKLIVRLHPNIADKASFIEYSDSVLNGTEYPSIDDLIIASDIVISDYSGVIFDGYKMEKIVLFHATDMDSYLKEDRKVYFDFCKMPSPLSQNDKELIKNVLEFDLEKYEQKRKKFVKDLGYYEKDAAALIAQQILDIMKKGD